MRVLTHNAYWFQGSPSRWGAERVAETPEVVEALTRLYASVNADVICLQEVHRADIAETIARELGMKAWFHAPGGVRRDYGAAVLCRRDAEFRDRTRDDGQALCERVHLRASVEWDGNRVELAVVHLPSNRFAGSAEAGDAARMAELKRAIADAPRPHLIVGDMNSLPDSPPYRFIRERGYVDAAVAAGAEQGPRHRIDYMWVDEAWAGRLVSSAVLDSGAFRRSTPEGGAWSLSDHPPLWMELR